MNILPKGSKMRDNIKIGIDFWKKFLSSLSSTYDIFFQLIDSSGNIILTGSNERTLCSYLSRFELACAKCKEYCVEIPKKSILENSVQRFSCYMGIRCFVIPVNISKEERAAVLGGKVLTDIPYSEAYSDKCRQLGIDIQEVLNSLHEIRFIKEKSINAYIDLVESFGSKGALVEENLNEYERKEKQFKRLLRGIDEINSFDVIDESFLNSMLKTASDAFLIKDASILLKDKGKFHSAADIRDYIDTNVTSSISLREDSPLIKEVMKSEGKPLFIDDSVLIAELGIKWGVESTAVIPLLKKEDLWGILFLFNLQKEEWNIENIQHFANGINVCIASIEMKRQLKNFDYNKRKLISLIENFSKLSHIKSLLDNVVYEISSFTNAKRVSVAILNKDLGKLELMAALGIDEAVLKSNRFIDENSISYYVFQEGKPVIVDDISRHERFSSLAHAGCKTNSFMSMPLKHNGQALGTINVSEIEDIIAPDDERYEWLKNRIKLISLLIERTILKNEMENIRSEFIDTKKGVYNKIYFNEFGKKRIENSRRNRRNDSVVILNIGDTLKQFPSQREDILKQVIDDTRREIRSSDIIAVYDENSITFFLPDTNKSGALLFAKKIKSKVEDLLLFFEQPGEEIKVSVGVSTFPDDGDDIAHLTLSAQRALQN
ncbi:MAG: GAF domain-containing protein [Candidatus Schekmanbacteria bacterium]|nr:MAG: GAF domain-containing protein [Candidatus Schekmanbacteria bacterium]